jgi:hypothetical protein
MLVHFSYCYQYMFKTHDLYNYTVKITHTVILRTVHISSFKYCEEYMAQHKRGTLASQMEL